MHRENPQSPFREQSYHLQKKMHTVLYLVSTEFLYLGKRRERLSFKKTGLFWKSCHQFGMLLYKDIPAIQQQRLGLDSLILKFWALRLNYQNSLISSSDTINVTKIDKKYVSVVRIKYSVLFEIYNL